MSGTIDPTWGVPLIFLTIAAIGVVWVKVTDRAFTRRHGPDPSAATPSSRPAPPRAP